MRKNNGFSLIEVLIAAVIVSVGVTALTVLQSKLAISYQGSELTQVANQLATDKLNDLRQLNSIHGFFAGPSYVQIQPNAGGTIPAGPTQIVLNPEQNIDHTFDLSWTVATQFFVDSDNDEQADVWIDENEINTPELNSHLTQRKQVVVNVTWTDPIGRTKQVLQKGTVIPVYRYTHKLELNQLEQTVIMPIVTASVESMVSQVSQERHRAIEHLALPQIFSTDLTSVTTLTLQRQQIDNKLIQIREFNTLACACQLLGEGQGKTPAGYQLQGNRLIPVKGVWTTKPIAKAIDGQPPLCDICCRDHHDTLPMLNSRNGYRQQQRAPHSHYALNTHGRYIKAQQVGDKYDEVCRLRRDNGIFELTYDWHAIQSVILKSKMDEDLQSSYQDFVADSLKSYVLGLPMPQSPFRSTLAVNGSEQQLQNRTLYIDPIANSDHDYISQQLNSQQLGWQSLLSFYDIDTTLQTQWRTSAPDIISISNQSLNVSIDIDSHEFGSFSRGKLTGINAGQANVIANRLFGNDGLLAVSAIEPLSQRHLIQIEHRRASYLPTPGLSRMSGLIHCIDNRFNTPRICNLHEHNNVDYVDLAPLIITITATPQTCAQHFPLSAATASFTCPDVTSLWQGQITANTTQLSIATEVFWLSPDGQRIDNHSANVSQSSLNTTEGQYQLVIQLN
ncbi:prepilin-type N-terminal cleavage/methylation domain-containing protein [Aliiglaciecola litoralis]|uniref:Prepilin-type N-terminal cleavage/methylation domain-containing protein n=1 Tax=Aliiglaciecola litoralis TaxID=582857 RepID=A0ABN1LMN5_9ALTE